MNSNPVWEGDLQDFMVNDDEKLQLSAADGDQSTLYTQLNFADTIQWDFEALMDFSPSTSNRLRIYLAIDQLNIDQASGYFIEIGENGAADALNFYHLAEGIPELIASGELAALGSDPAFLKVNALYFPNGEWRISTAYIENQAVIEELVFIHDTYDFSGNQIFQLECNYTSSRSDKFFFDNIGIKKYELDKEGPIIISAEIIDATHLNIQANEKLASTSVIDLSNYTISNYSGRVTAAVLSENETAITLELDNPLNSGTTHTLTIKGISDINGNTSQSYDFDIFLIEEAIAGDLALNEILFNPETGGSDFVEIINISDKYIFLGNLELNNASKLESKPIGSDIVIKPGAYLCFTEDIQYLKDRYETPDSANFLNVDLPSFNNEDGNVQIVNSISGEIIDSYDYEESQHFQQLDDFNGVSLERISPFDDKWFSASSASLFATPGYQNSVFRNPNIGNEELLSFESKTFSPNQDGVDDQLIINYKLPGNGYQVDIDIYDQYGRLVRTLINNELFSEEGFVFWDGLNENGERLDIGIYFVVLEAYNEQANVVGVKKPAILADFLD
ncbi:hypothetical protein GCM10007940_24160 [Portibacter lacus]|uniref:LTD domain-containing protein n=1 Tax=Portibacter lacus TaxID=1099794 RepID=A0AA37WDA3_9BACT|nr:hypothetical protein GCM10007940_24160 [Portibacter lacus]